MSLDGDRFDGAVIHRRPVFEVIGGICPTRIDLGVEFRAGRRDVGGRSRSNFGTIRRREGQILSVCGPQRVLGDEPKVVCRMGLEPGKRRGGDALWSRARPVRLFRCAVSIGFGGAVLEVVAGGRPVPDI